MTDTENKSPITFVCVATGSLYGKADLYINRLYHMIQKFSPEEFKLICVTDRPRLIEKSITQIDCSNWDEFKKMIHTQPITK